MTVMTNGAPLVTSAARYRGVFPVVPTTFTPSGELDLPSQLRCVDFMIDAGSNGLCILANFSEQFVLADDEREVLTTVLSAPLLARMASEIEQIAYFKIETAGAASKLRELLSAKALMQEGGVIACEAPRDPLPAMHPATRSGWIETARRLDPLVLRWGH